MKLKIYLLFSFCIFANVLHAQVGIGNTTPNAILDVSASNVLTPSNKDGILIPRIDAFPVSNPGVLQKGMLVFLNNTVGVNLPGFYYWDGTSSWIGLNSTSSSDSDWFKVGTTTAPTLITDSMFHTGNVAIGKNTTNYPLDILTTAFDTGINAKLSNNSTNGISKIGITNTINGTTGDISYGIYNDIYGTGSGIQYGINNSINNSGNSAHFGTSNDLIGTGSGSHFGVYNDLSGTGTGKQYGSSSFISNSGNNTHYGSNTILSGSGSGIHYGSYTDLSGAGTGNQLGNYTSIGNTGNAIHYGNYIDLSGAGTGNQFGTNVAINNSGGGVHYGNFNDLSNTGNGNQFGISNLISNSGTGLHYGSYSILSGAGTGSQYGNYNNITNTGNGAQYGSYSTLTGTGTGNKFGFYSLLNTAAGGTHYGIYSEVLKAGTNYAGYFLGNVAIGTTNANNYIFPASRGTIGQIMQTDGSGNVTWVAPTALSITETDPQVTSTTSNVIPKWNGTTLVDGIVTDDGTNVGVGIAPSAGNKLEVAGKTKTTNFQMTTGAAVNSVLQSDASGNASWQSLNGFAWGILGNSGTVATTNFLGTTDDVDFVMKRNGIRSGFIGNPNLTTGNRNTSFGANTLNAAGTGTRNTAIGTNVLPLNTTGNRNTAIGNTSLSVNTTGNLNTSVGESSMTLNTIGIENTAIGAGSLYSNVDGRYNTGSGRNTLTSNVSGWYNTASGYAALRTSIGNYNTATGANALYNSIGEGNTAEGVQSSVTNTTGNYNTSLGFQSLFSNSIGNNNVAIGNQAGYFETTSDKLYIENSNANEDNALIYGDFNANILRTNSQFQIGNPAVSGYALPVSRGTVNQVLQTDGAGNTNWVAPSTLAITETDPQVTSTTANKIPKWNGTTLVDGIITDDGTNVGIGVAPSAGNKLEVAGKTKTTDFQMTNGATTGYVLQSDATGNATWANANTKSIVRTNLNASQSLSNGGWQLVTFNTVVMDTNSEFNTGTSRFTATKAGYYQINSGIHTNDQSNTDLYSIGVRKNGAFYQQTTENHSNLGPVSRNINCIVNLAIGDYIEIFVENYQSGVTVDGFVGKSFFEIIQIQ
jgi:trimeric autotransporter adhesin